LKARLFVEDNSLIGLISQDRILKLNPPIDRVLEADDRLIVIAPDNQAVQLNPGPGMLIRDGFITSGESQPAQPRKILILGWNWRGPKIIQELNHYVPPGSQVMVLADQEKVEEFITRESKILNNLEINLPTWQHLNRC
jgi:hypothetical protein